MKMLGNLAKEGDIGEATSMKILRHYEIKPLDLASLHCDRDNSLS